MPKLTLSFKGRLLDVFHIDRGHTLIGRDRTCEINIDSLAIAPRHARIHFDQTRCRIERLDDDFPVQVNHNSTTAVELHHGDVIRVGKHTLTYSDDAIEPAGELTPKTPLKDTETTANDESPTSGHGMLQIMNGDNFGRIIPLNSNMTRIGRVGGNCAMIARRESGYYLSHLEGRSSPAVNDKPIGDASLLLNDGDVILVGKTKMQFHT
jgi:pSer/pThr/pTyr-binding forkhead associated (FHA) protein